VKPLDSLSDSRARSIVKLGPGASLQSLEVVFQACLYPTTDIETASVSEVSTKELARVSITSAKEECAHAVMQTSKPLSSDKISCRCILRISGQLLLQSVVRLLCSCW
jgi:hypothetical protein